MPGAFMKTKFLALAILTFLFSCCALAQEHATAQEVVEKVRAAADTLARSATSDLAQFNQKQGPWVWKDTYIFVFDSPRAPSLPTLSAATSLAPTRASSRAHAASSSSPSCAKRPRIPTVSGSSTGGRSRAKRKPRARSATR